MGTLYIVATPIGNLEDISVRALKTLLGVDYVACEDTRRTGLLLQELKKRYPHVLEAHLHLGGVRLIRYDDRGEHPVTPEIMELLSLGKSVALVSDAGTPLISDPGYVLVREARKRGVSVVSIPGASAVLTALTSSGFPGDKFLFLGYPPEKQSHRKKLFASLPTETTIIFYCAPHKLLQTLEDMKEMLGDIRIVISRELTKVHEEYWSGTISLAIEKYQHPKGEFVLLLAPSAQRS